MKYAKILLISILFIVSTISLVYSEESINTKQIWKIASLDWQPYAGSDIHNYGNSIEILRNLLKLKNIELEVHFYPWTRSIYTAAEDTTYIGYFPAWPEEVDSVNFKSSVPLDYSKISIVANFDNTMKYDNLKQIYSKTNIIGIISSYIYPIQIELLNKYYTNKIDESLDESTIIKKLINSRIEIGISDPSVLLYHAKLLNCESQIKILADIQDKELVLAIRNDKFELVNNILIQALKAQKN